MKNLSTVIKRIPWLGRVSVSLYSRILRIRNTKFLRKNYLLRNAIARKRVFVIATGPSIKKQDLKPLKNEVCISVSNFYLHADFASIKPLYHFFAASHPPITDEQYGALFKDAQHYFPRGQKVFISLTDKHIVEKYEVFKEQEVYYYSLGNRPLADTIDFTKDIPTIQSSPHAAIYLALFGGASAIYLLGCDHDWILHLKEPRHFYDEKQSVLAQRGYNEWFEEDLELQFSSHVSLWKTYKKIRSYCTKRNIPVYNCSPTSLLDIFPAKRLEDVIIQKSVQPLNGS